MAQETPDLAGASTVEEARRIHKLVHESADSEGFRSFEVKFGEDSTGDPAVWIWFSIDPQYPTSKEGIQKLSRVRRRVRSALLGARLDRIPYIRFREKSAAAG